METKFTKGKWEYIKGCERGFAKVDINGRILDFGDLKFDLDSLDEENANALLISKAPEMFEILATILVKTKMGIYLTKSDLPYIEQLLKEATEL